MKNPTRRLRLTKTKVLAWADARRRRTGQYPTARSGPVQPGWRLTWKRVDASLRDGYYGLPGGDSLARLLAEHRGVRNRGRLPHWTYAQILRWADAHFRRTGRWPHCGSGPVRAAAGETWQSVQNALIQGLRGLPGRSSLARLLAQRGRKRNRRALPNLTVEQILTWAEAFARRTQGSWPTAESGPVPEAPGETWKALNTALRQGHRTLPAGTSLARLVRLYRNLKLRTDAGEPLWEGRRIFEGTAAQFAARFLARRQHERGGTADP